MAEMETPVPSVPSLSKEIVKELENNGYLITNLSDKKEEETEVLCKLCIKGKASKLANVLSNLMSTYYQSNSSYSKGFDTELKMTFMIEKVKDS